MLSRVHRRVAQVLPCDVVATFRWEESSNAFRAVAEHGVPAELRQDMMQLRMARGTFGGRTRRGQPVVINDVTEQSWLSPELCARFRIAALIAVPLLVRNRHFGTLVAYSMVPNRFDDGQVELCEAIAHQLAVALEGAELYVAQQEQAAVAGALARVAQELIASLDRPTSMERFCELVTEVLDCEVAQTWLWNASEQMYLPAAAHGYTREEWEQLRTLRLPLEVVEQAMGGGAEVSEVRAGESTDNDSRPTLLCFGESVQLCMRLHLGDETIGIQCAGYRRSQPISPTQRRIARGIGQVASMALSHARLVDELARANRLKSDFVATMSHELRTPLNTLMGYTDLLAAGEFGPVNGEQRNVLERMDHSARELLDLINATLDLSRIEARRLPIEVREVEMPELLRELDHETRYQRQRRGLELLWEVSEDSVRICSDRVKLKVILKNLLSNALKFTERGAVRIHVHSQNSGIEISVQDSGVGIQPDILPIIFEPFRQGERAATRRFGGVGLGLYVVRRLLDLLEGSITVESEPGRGSTFRVWLPSLSATAAIE
jgi:signal transduction histidine kinase